MSGPTTGAAVITISPACGERVIHINAASISLMLIENLSVRGGRESANFGHGGGLLIASPPVQHTSPSTVSDT
jgi:hypothetical protein